MGSSHQTRLKSTDHTAMDASSVWYNVPITITRTSGETNSPKKVRWSNNLTQVKTISPRYKASPWSWPQQKNCSHFVCTAGEPCKMFQRFNVSQDPGLAYNNNNNVSTASFNCSPQLKKVVIQAVNSNNNNYWKPDKKELSLNLGNNYWSNSTS